MMKSDDYPKIYRGPTSKTDGLNALLIFLDLSYSEEVGFQELTVDHPKYFKGLTQHAKKELKDNPELASLNDFDNYRLIRIIEDLEEVALKPEKLKSDFRAELVFLYGFLKKLQSQQVEETMRNVRADYRASVRDNF